MSDRPTSLVASAGLLILIGISGVTAGSGLLIAGPSATVTDDVRRAGLGIGGVMAAYALGCIVAGAGLWLRRRWAWLLGIGVIGVGLALLLYVVWLAGTDPVIVFGLVVWGVTLAALLVAPTRRALV